MVKLILRVACRQWLHLHTDLYYFCSSTKCRISVLSLFETVSFRRYAAKMFVKRLPLLLGTREARAANDVFLNGASVSAKQ